MVLGTDWQTHLRPVKHLPCRLSRVPAFGLRINCFTAAQIDNAQEESVWASI
jgi:hypothetical protein